jgi:predicted O-methyltransferase YrrM
MSQTSTASTRPRSELLYRLRDPAFIADQTYCLIADAIEVVSPTEFGGFYRRVRPMTMSNSRRLRGLYSAVRHAIQTDVAGDVVECGTARGGSAALMGLTLKAHDNRDRKIVAFDTFAGLPPPTHDDPDYDIAQRYTGSCIGTLEQVSAFFTALGIRDRAVFVQGLFQATLPEARLGPISVLHVDGDWYESVKTCLDHLYDKVSPGGVIQIDDYGWWQGAAKAVDEFFKARAIAPALRRLDYSGRQFVKRA